MLEQPLVLTPSAPGPQREAVMLSVAFLLCAGAVGVAIVRFVIGRAANLLEQIAAGLCVGWMTATLLAYAAARTAGALSFSLMLWVTLGLAVIAAAAWAWLAQHPRPSAHRTTSRAESLALAAVLVILLPLYCALFETRMLQQRADGLYSGGSSLYDMAFHMAVSTSFVYGQNFPPIYPVLPPAPLLYPPLPDFLTAALVAGGLSFHAALCLTAITVAAALTTIFYFLAARLIASAAPATGKGTGRAAALATALFLFNGGFGFIHFLRSLLPGAARFSYSQLTNGDLQWTNIIVDGFLPQRTTLFGLPATLLVFGMFGAAWWDWSKESNARWSGWRMLVGAGLVTAMLPLFHAHSYLAICLVSGFLFLLRPRVVWIAFWVPAILPGIANLLALTSHVTASANIRFEPQWFGRGNSSLPLALLMNIGLPVVLIVPAWLSAPAVWRRFYVAFVGLLAVALFVVFSPNDTDNLKLLFYWYAPTCVLIARWLMIVATRSGGRFIVALVVAGCTASALLGIVHELSTRERIFTRAEQAAASFAQQNTRPDALFISAPTLHQPIVSLAGRATVRGATSWLWSHGYDFRAREGDVRRIYAAALDAAELIDYYHADFIYLGETERRDFHTNEAFFDSRFPLIYSSGAIKIYRARGSGAAGAGGRNYQPPPRDYSRRIRHDPAQWFVEFPRISYFIYRFYVVTLGRAPRFAECLPDLESLGRELYVGAPGWEARLEQNKRQFLGDWTRRFGSVKSGDELATAADDPRLFRREYDAAYLLMHYFGYLRRNPEEAPDNSMAGFEFWLANLKRTHDYRAIGRAFLESAEYQNRPIEIGAP